MIVPIKTIELIDKNGRVAIIVTDQEVKVLDPQYTDVEGRGSEQLPQICLN